MCGPVSLEIVWLGHTYYPTASMACLLCVPVLPVLVEDVPLAVRRDMCFQHPANFSAQTQKHLNTQPPDMWLGCGGPVSWPTRSPDLNPLDFFLWGHLKEIIYSYPPTALEDLSAKFHSAVANIDRRAQVSIPRRAVACRQKYGGHFEHLL
jgi:hypothetical protein